jgi:hypothetical protein
LLVLDDGDLHQRQTPFSIGASRAIASTLNSLVFHTAFPEQAGAQLQQQPGQQLKHQAGAMQGPSVDVLPPTLSHGMVSMDMAQERTQQHASNRGACSEHSITTVLLSRPQ